MDVYRLHVHAIAPVQVSNHFFQSANIVHGAIQLGWIVGFVEIMPMSVLDSNGTHSAFLLATPEISEIHRLMLNLDSLPRTNFREKSARNSPNPGKKRKTACG